MDRCTSKVLVFVKGQALLNYVSWFNIDDFPGNVIVARDLGDDNLRLMRRFPEHAPILIDPSGRSVDLARVK